MEGYLIQIFGEGIEELYWTSEEIDDQEFKDLYKLWLNASEREDGEEFDFEEWWYHNPSVKGSLERVFIDEIYL